MLLRLSFRLSRVYADIVLPSIGGSINYISATRIIAQGRLMEFSLTKFVLCRHLHSNSSVAVTAFVRFADSIITRETSSF